MNPARSLGPALFAGGDAARARLAVHRRAADRWRARLWSPCRAIAWSPRRPAGRPACHGDRDDRTGAELPPEEQPVQIPPPATAHDDARCRDAVRPSRSRRADACPGPGGWPARVPAGRGAVWATCRAPLPDRTCPRTTTPRRSDGAGATITPYRDGPLIVRGDFRLLDQDGAEIDPGRDTIALCRCGKSGIKPFCDGIAQAVGVLRAERAEPAPAGRADRARRRAGTEAEPRSAASRTPSPSAPAPRAPAPIRAWTASSSPMTSLVAWIRRTPTGCWPGCRRSARTPAGSPPPSPGRGP